MAIAAVGSATKTENASGTSLVVTTVTGGANGDLLVTTVGVSSSASITPPAGWTLIPGTVEDAGSNLGIAGYYRVTTGTESASYTWTTPAGASTGIMRRYSGVAGTAFDIAGTYETTTVRTSFPVPSVSSTLDGGMLLSSLVVNATTAADISSPSGMVIPSGAKSTGTGRRTALAEQLLGGAGGTGTKTWGSTSGVKAAAWMVVLRSAAPSVPAAPTTNAGVDTTGTAGTLFTRTATETGSSITSRAWTIVSGPSGAGSTIGSAAALSWTPPAAGTFVLRYSATNTGGTGTDDMTLTVSAAPAGTTLGIVATVQASNLPPRVRLDITDASAVPYFSATVTRLNPDGTTSVVRTFDGNPLVLTTSGATRVGLLYDYEMPYQGAVQYSTVEAPWETSAQVTVPENRVWLIHPGVPEISKPITVASFSARESKVQRGVFYPMGRPAPVVQTDGSRKTAEFTLGVLTTTDAEREALGAILADAGPLLLNVPITKAFGVAAEYVSVGDVSEGRVSRFAGEPTRLWQLPCLVIDNPEGGSQSERTYTDLLTFASYTELQRSYSTYLALLAGP